MQRVTIIERAICHYTVTTEFMCVIFLLPTGTQIMPNSVTKIIKNYFKKKYRKKNQSQ